MRKLQKHISKYAKKSEVLMLLPFVLIALVAVSYLQEGLIMEAILVLLGFYPGVLAFYAIFKYSRITTPKTVKPRYWLRPVIVTGTLYPLAFYVINTAKYNFFPPKDLYGELLFFIKLVVTSLSFSFFMGGLTAKLSRLKSELYFLVSGTLSVFLAGIDTVALAAVGPLPGPLGFSTTAQIALLLGAILFTFLIVYGAIAYGNKTEE